MERPLQPSQNIFILKNNIEKAGIIQWCLKAQQTATFWLILGGGRIVFECGYVLFVYCWSTGVTSFCVTINSSNALAGMDA